MKRTTFQYLIRCLIVGSVAVIIVSCATIRNSCNVPVSIYADKNSKIIFGRDTLKSLNPTLINATRQKSPLRLTIITDSVSHQLIVNSFYSLNYYFNIASNYGIGMLVDKKNPKRYAYPKRLYLTNTKDSVTYALFKKNYRNSIKLNTLKLIGAINAGAEFTYERYTGKKFSTVLLLAYIYSECWICDGGGDGKGLQFALEQKYFLKAHEETRLYFSLEGGSVVLSTETSPYVVPKFGMQIYPRERFLMDVSFGLGAQNRDFGTEDSFIDLKVPLNWRVGWRF